MKSNHITLILAIALGTASQAVLGQSEPIKSENHSDVSISRIAFGACNNPRKDKDGMYQAILGEKPEVFVFLGDNIYGDTKDMEVLKKKYGELEAENTHRLRIEKTGIPELCVDDYAAIIVGGSPFDISTPEDQKQPVQLKIIFLKRIKIVAHLYTRI